MSSGHDFEVTIPANYFKDLTKAITNFNRRTDRINADLKRKKYQKVSRYPTNHNTVKNTVTVRIVIGDRAKVLYQELTEIINGFRVKPQKQSKQNEMAIPIRFGVWIPCASESDAVALARILSLSGARVESK